MKFLAAKSNPHLITLIVITAASIVSLNMFLPSLANMATEFDVSYRVMNISVAGYLAVTAFLQIIIGPLSDRYGRRIILLFSVIIFCFSTIGCIYSSNIWWFLFFRILQGGAGEIEGNRGVAFFFVYPDSSIFSRLLQDFRRLVLVCMDSFVWT